MAIIIGTNPNGEVLTGTAADDSITGAGGPDTLLGGGGGADTFAGGGGNDVYFVDSLDDLVLETGGNGRDRVLTSANYALAANGAIEQLFASGFIVGGGTFDSDGTRNLNTSTTSPAAGIYLVGNDASQLIIGDGGNNILNGFRGVNGDGTGNSADTLAGLQGDDIYRVYAQNDVVVEDTAGGGDIIYTSASYDLAVNDTAARAASFDDREGTVRFDTYLRAGAASEIEVLSTAVNAGTEAIDLAGNAYGNILIGNYGNNVLRGGGTTAGGVDVLYGLRGDDTYYIDSTSTFINEASGEGNDSAIIGTNVALFTLNSSSSVEALTSATGTNAQTIIGNQLSQTITGNAGNNVLNGGGGGDRLVGGAGDDTYLVTSQSDDVIDLATTNGTVNQGFDTIFTTVSYDLGSNAGPGDNPFSNLFLPSTFIRRVEVLSAANQQGTDNIYLIGNETSQLIVGNYGNNILVGDNDLPAGLRRQPDPDTLVGLYGDDTYRVNRPEDVIREVAGQGNDTVYTSQSYQLRTGNEVEVLSAANQSSAQGLLLIGNEFNQTIIGAQGSDTLYGGGGNDLLIGLGGYTNFYCFTEVGAANADTIQSFGPGDRIGLPYGPGETFSAVAGGPSRNVDTEEFVVGTAALDANDYIIYDQATGRLFYDADGNGSGAAQLFATLPAGTFLDPLFFVPVAQFAPIPGA